MGDDFLGELRDDEGELIHAKQQLQEQEAGSKKHLLEAVSYKQDIEPYGFVELISGLGSGKNFFINKLSKGVKKGEDGALEDIEKKTVLLITSRRAKADEVRNDETVTMVASVDAWEYEWALDNIKDIEEYFESGREIQRLGSSNSEWDAWGTVPTIHQPSTAWTGAGLEQYLKTHYNPVDSTTHLWNRFDLIVVDEVHSVVADASYQSAPFYVQAFINEAYQRYQSGESNCRVIVMTGSPKILKNYSLPSNANRINKMDECINTVPQRVVFVTKAQAHKMLLEKLENGERVAYYFNHIGDMLNMTKCLEKTAIYDRTAVSFTDEKRRDELEKSAPALHDRMIRTEKHIMINQCLPEETQLFLSTSKNKEGINIKDENIKTLFVESHAEVDIVQTAGRIREGVEFLYIITDSAQHEAKESRFEYRFSRRGDLLAIINDELKKAAKTDNVDLHQNFLDRKPVGQYPTVKGYIRYIHEKFPYIRYNYFKDEFVFYKQRRDSFMYYADQHRLFESCLSSPEMLEQLASSWFPGVPVTVLSNVQQRVDEYFESNHWLNGERVIKDKERKQILADLNEITAEGCKQLKTLLGHYGYSLNKPGHKADSPATIIRIQSIEGEVA